jgi:hypothetical protein
MAGPGTVVLPGRDGYLGKRGIKRKPPWGAGSTSGHFTTRCWRLGSVPLQVLEDRIDLFIAQGGKGPYPDME